MILSGIHKRDTGFPLKARRNDNCDHRTETHPRCRSAFAPGFHTRPLAGIACLTALSGSCFPGPARASSPSSFASEFFRPLPLGCLALAGIASYLVLPAYRDPELAPPFWLGVVSGLGVLLVSGPAALRPARAFPFIFPVGLISLITARRAFLLTRQPLADFLTHPAPAGYGIVLTGGCSSHRDACRAFPFW